MNNQTPNQELPISIQDLEMIARSGSTKSQKFTNFQILIDATISMKPQLVKARLRNLIGAIHALGVAAGANTMQLNFGGLKTVEADISEELGELIDSNLTDKALWSGTATTPRKLLPVAAQQANRKTKFLVITDGFFLVGPETVSLIEEKGHAVDVLILDHDGVNVSMPSSNALRVTKISANAENGRDFLSQISN